jgi:hypothetical protein
MIPRAASTTKPVAPPTPAFSVSKSLFDAIRIETIAGDFSLIISSHEASANAPHIKNIIELSFEK